MSSEAVFCRAGSGGETACILALGDGEADLDAFFFAINRHFPILGGLGSFE